jgi:hypothetical protein
MLNKLTFFICVVIFCNDAYSESSYEYKKLLLENYHRSISKYEKKEQECKGNSIVLPRDIFSNIVLTEQELISTLSFYFYKNHLHCTATARVDYLAYATLLSLQSESSRNMVEVSNELLTYNYKTYLEQELEFLKLSTNLRVQLEKISLLKSPFLLVESFDALDTREQ